MLKKGSHIDENFVKSVDESVAQVKKDVIKNLKESANRPLPDVETLFEDVYHSIPKHLEQQQKELKENFENYSSFFPKDRYQFRK